MSITPGQCKAARELLGWTVLDLGYRARISDSTVMRFEAARLPIRPEKAQAMRTVLEAAGVIFVEENGEGPGVRLKKTK
jgi:transcriptional regulator with XRE-family HTH domain